MLTYYCAELKLNDDPTITINILTQVCIKSALPLLSYAYFNCYHQSPGVLQTILNRNVEVSEQTKSVLDGLGKARKFLETIMEFGAIASEVSR